MKNYHGEMISKYYETEAKGKLTGTYGSGQVKTGAISLDPGTYVVTVRIENDTSVGNSLSTGVYHARVQTNSGNTLLSGSHTGDSGYPLAFTVSQIVNFESETSFFALGQTTTSASVNGGLKVILRAVKVN